VLSFVSVCVCVLLLCAEHAMRHLPSGQLGSLVIYKSGKIKMRIGDILLDVS